MLLPLLLPLLLPQLSYAHVPHPGRPFKPVNGSLLYFEQVRSSGT
jgi:hypothetical protein